MNFKTEILTPSGDSAQGGIWLFSWPLIIALLVYSLLMFHGDILLRDADTYWHIATGQWILEHRAIPTLDPFSHTMRGMPWTAHEWLSELILAISHNVGGWTGVIAIPSLAYAATLAILTRVLLKSMEPAHAVLCVAFAIAMTKAHLLARPHVLALPCMMLWTVGLVQGSESGRSPRLWLLPVMTLWANLHGGFTLGLALTFACAIEALFNARHTKSMMITAKSWALFTALAVISSLLTPHGMQGIFFTWQILFEGTYALAHIGEWLSPNFHTLQPVELWLLGLLALVIYHGLKLPPMRLLLLLGLLHLSLKHQRNIDLLGLLVPILVAAPFAVQWREKTQNQQNAETLDRIFRKLAQSAGQAAVVAAFLLTLLLTPWVAHNRAPQPEEAITPHQAIQAVKKAGISGPVFNEYSWGGYLIYLGIPPFIDGRADMYGDVFFKAFVEALLLTKSDSLENLLDKYKIEWTLLTPGSPAVALLDHLPAWRRLYADKVAVVHVRTDASQTTAPDNK